jgi:ABC-type glycerol-3-phosphate transport system substrate-binding protein
LRASEKKDAVLKFVDWMSQPERNTSINEKIGLVPAHPDATISETSQKWAVKADELDQFAYYPDWDFMSVHLPELTKRFETEIQPLL